MSDPLYLVSVNLVETLVASLPRSELEKLKEALDFAIDYNSKNKDEAKVFCNEHGTTYKVLIVCPMTGDYELIFRAG